MNEKILPETVISSAEVYGTVEDRNCQLHGTPLAGILGDQQAALVGQTWPDNNNDDDQFPPRPKVKVTFGTGAFLLWNVGSRPVYSPDGLLTTIAYQMGAGAKPYYALEVQFHMGRMFHITPTYNG